MRRTLSIFGSLVLPGWGHYTLGRTRRGMFWLTAATLALFAGAAFGSLWLWLALLLRPAAALDTALLRPGAAPPSPARALLVFVVVGFGVVLPPGLLATAARRYLVEDFGLSASSMLPTVQLGDRLLVRKRPLMASAPARGDVIVFRFPHNERLRFVQRVIALPGDTVGVSDDTILLNRASVPREPVLGPCEFLHHDETSDKWRSRTCHAWRETLGSHHYTVIQDEHGAARWFPAVVVPANSYFVLGDNRDHANDSRAWGFVTLDQIEGIVGEVWLSSGEPEGLRLRRIGTRIE